MSRRSRPKDIGVGQDSFLDLISNIVGILIILVVLVGSQVKDGLYVGGPESDLPAAEVFPDETPESAAERNISSGKRDAELARTRELADARMREMIRQDEELQRIQTEMGAVSRRMEEIAGEREFLETEIVSADSQRVEVGRTATAIQQQLDTLNTAEDGRKSELFRLERQAESREKEVVKMQERLALLEKPLPGADGGPMKIPHKLTPISRTVETEEAQFILKEGRILFIPMNDLIALFQRRMNQNVGSLIMSGQRNDVIGPVEGFILHTKTVLSENNRQNVYFTLETPPLAQVGETPRMALAEISKFRDKISKLNPRKTVITIWVYPSGFSEFQPIKEEFYRLGFSIASRPLPEHVPISASPDGRKSMAQ